MNPPPSELRDKAKAIVTKMKDERAAVVALLQEHGFNSWAEVTGSLKLSVNTCETGTIEDGEFKCRSSGPWYSKVREGTVVKNATGSMFNAYTFTVHGDAPIAPPALSTDENRVIEV